MKIIICGGSASGKDWLLNQFKNNNYKISIKYTTRPKRSTETEGIDYNYINNQQFNYIKNRGYMPIHQEFIIDDVLWQYGFSNDKLNSADVLILTPHEIKQYIQYQKDNKFEFNDVIIYLNIDRDIRKSRIESRNDKNDEVERRLISDDNSFKDFKDFDIEITNPDFTYDDIIKSIEQINI